MSKRNIVADRGEFTDGIDNSPIGQTTPAAGSFTTLETTGILQGPIESELNVTNLIADVLGLMTDPRLLFARWENPAGGYAINHIPDGHLESLGIAFVDSNPDTITDTGSQFVDQGFQAGNIIRISGSTSNDGTYTIATVAAGTLTLVAGDSLTAEVAGDRVTIDCIATYQGTWASGDRELHGRTYVLDPNGTDAYLNVGDGDRLSVGNGSNDSAATWFGVIEVVDSITSQFILSKRDITTGSELREYAHWINSSELLKIEIFDESANVGCSRIINTALSVGIHSYAITYNGVGGANAADGITIYIDGLEVASTATNNGAYVAMENLTVPVWIGANEGTGGTPAAFMTGDFGLQGMDGVEMSAEDAYNFDLIARAYYSVDGINW